MFGYSVPTAYRLLRALEAENFLVFDRTSRAYSPGPEILGLAGVMLHRDALVSQTQTSLIRLRALTGETVAVYWRLGNKCTCTQEMPSPQPSRIEAGIGVDYPLTRGAEGKALLLDLSDDEVRALLAEPDVPEPIGGVEALLTELAASRKRGYTVSIGETIEGAVSIAAPIPWMQQGLAVYSVTGPESRLGPQAREMAARTLVAEMARLRAILRAHRPRTAQPRHGSGHRRRRGGRRRSARGLRRSTRALRPHGPGDPRAVHATRGRRKPCPWRGLLHQPERGAIPEWDNTFNPTSWDKWLEYDAQASASQLKQPLLVIHSEAAASPQSVHEFVAKVSGQVEQVWLDNVTQFDFYDQPGPVETAANAAARHFAVTRSGLG